MNIMISFIYGAMLGIEIMDPEVCQEQEIAWGLIIDLFIFRIYLWGDFQEPEAKPA